MGGEEYGHSEYAIVSIELDGEIYLSPIKFYY